MFGLYSVQAQAQVWCSNMFYNLTHAKHCFIRESSAALYTLIVLAN